MTTPSPKPLDLAKLRERLVIDDTEIAPLLDWVADARDLLVEIIRNSSFAVVTDKADALLRRLKP